MRHMHSNTIVQVDLVHLYWEKKNHDGWLKHFIVFLFTDLQNYRISNHSPITLNRSVGNFLKWKKNACKWSRFELHKIRLSNTCTDELYASNCIKTNPTRDGCTSSWVLTLIILYINPPLWKPIIFFMHHWIRSTDIYASNAMLFTIKKPS